MTTKLGMEDPFDEVERGLDWLERLEGLRARQDREGAIRETVEYVDALREALATFAGDVDAGMIAERYGPGVAAVVEGVRDGDAKDPWVDYLKPALLEE